MRMFIKPCKKTAAHQQAKNLYWVSDGKRKWELDEILAFFGFDFSQGGLKNGYNCR